MVESISILISNGVIDKLKILIVPKMNICYMNQKKYSINNKTIDSILDILATWKYEYGTSNTIDSEEFTIIVNSDNKKTKYHGKGIFPRSYNKVLEIIEGLEYDG